MSLWIAMFLVSTNVVYTLIFLKLIQIWMFRGVSVRPIKQAYLYADNAMAL